MSLLPVPPRRRPMFMLTPLVDVMFLLLIFFMLSSQTSPYALMRVSANATEATAAAASPQQVAAREAELIVGIGKGQVRLNGAAIDFAALPKALDDYKTKGVARAALIVGHDATVQDVVSTLEIFEFARFGAVRLVSQAVSSS